MDNNLKERIKGYYLLKGSCSYLEEEVNHLVEIFKITRGTSKVILTQLDATGDIELKDYRLFELQNFVNEYTKTQIQTQKQQYILYTNAAGRKLLEKAFQDEFKKQGNTVPDFKKYKELGFKKRGKKKP